MLSVHMRLPKYFSSFLLSISFCYEFLEDLNLHIDWLIFYFLNNNLFVISPLPFGNLKQVIVELICCARKNHSLWFLSWFLLMYLVKPSTPNINIKQHGIVPWLLNHSLSLKDYQNLIFQLKNNFPKFWERNMNEPSQWA